MKLRKAKNYVSGIVIMLLSSMVMSPAAGFPDPADPAPGQVMILYDEYGTPHVFGATPELLWYGVGYAVGQDRLWQADLLRRTTTGTSAELLGPDAVEGDQLARTLWGPSEWRASLLAAASPETRLIFRAFAAGMNAWIEEARQTQQLPIEYGGLSPRSWTPEDSVAVVLLIFGQFGEFGADELTNAAQLQEFTERFGKVEGAKVFLDTHWLNDPAATTTVPAQGAVNPIRRYAASAAQLPAGVYHGLNQWKALQRGWERNLDRLGIKRKSASNAMVIGPSLTATGGALLLGGPQMGYSVPQITYEIGIHAANSQITGITFPGMPAIAIGVTDQFAWTFTSGITDNSDIYAEELNPANPSQYRFQGHWVNFDCRFEQIEVRADKSLSFEVCKSVHGPVVGSAPGVAFTLKSASRGLEIQTLEALLTAQKARTGDQIGQAVIINQIGQAMSNFGANFNLFVADIEGNIAYWHLGKIPIHAEGDNPWLPHDGTGKAEWQGFVPWKDMPSAINPAQGWMSNWNNKPSLAWDNAVFGFGDWGPVHRVNTLNNLLKQLKPGTVTVKTLEEINRRAGWTTDTPSGAADPVFVSTLLDDMLAHIDRNADQRLPAVLKLLSGWDRLQVDANGDGYYDSPAVAIFNSWWLNIVDRVFADDLGSAFNDTTFDPLVLTGNLTYRLLKASTTALPLQHDYLNGETVREAITGALITTLNDLSAQYRSPDPTAWRQPIASIIWQPFGAGTVPDTIWMNRGTYNQIIQLGPKAKLVGENVVAPGQSGNPDSPHFSDQLSLYANWLYKPMRLNRADLDGHIESVVFLNP